MNRIFFGPVSKEIMLFLEKVEKVSIPLQDRERSSWKKN